MNFHANPEILTILGKGRQTAVDPEHKSKISRVFSDEVDAGSAQKMR